MPYDIFKNPDTHMITKTTITMKIEIRYKSELLNITFMTIWFCCKFMLIRNYHCNDDIRRLTYSKPLPKQLLF